MNFIADANIPRQVIERLRGEGHAVEAVSEMNPEMADREILELANQRSAIVSTADTDFGDLVFRQAHLSVGVILVRLWELSPDKRAMIILEAVRRYGTALPGSFTASAPGHVRLRART